MSGLETLPPDQRAVLQLILTQGRGYAELARMLRIDASAVRIRAHAGIDALAGAAGESPDAARRAQISDYLLGQQDEGERLVTLVELGDSTAACRWAAALRAQLLPLSREPLPEVPEPVATNGTVAAAALAAPIAAPVVAQPAAAPPAPPTPAPAQTPPAPVAAAQPAVPAPAPPPVPVAAPPVAAPAAAAQAPAPAPPAEPPAEDPPASGTSPSRRGGAILLGAAAAVALAVVLAIVLIGGNGDDDPTSAPAAQTTPAQTTGGQTSTTGTGQPAGKIVAQVNLLATPEGGQAVGLGFVQRVKRQLGIAIQADKLPANGAQDIYAAWISGPPGTKLLGFVPNQVKANGTFTVSAGLPANAAQYDSILITREAAAQNSPVPTQPGAEIMRGTLTIG